MRETDCVWSETAASAPKRTGRKAIERTEVRDARLDRLSVHGEESVAFSRSIGMELDSSSCQLALNIKYSNFEDGMALIPSSVT